MLKEIRIKSLALTNFKGIRNLTLPFGDVTTISGDNATGKTTINDAFRWLLFDKDSTDRKQFGIKTLDENNNIIEGLEHTVIAVIMVNQEKKVYQKTFKEIWTKKRGGTETTFNGNETLYYINDIPVKAGEYKVEINNIIDETIFKLLTDPLYFGNTMEWQERRKILVDMTGGDLSNEQIIECDTKLARLLEFLTPDMTVEKLKISLAARRKKMNDELETLPVRIDECYKSIKEVDKKALNAKLAELQTEFDSIETELSSITEESSSSVDLKNQLSELRAKITKIENDVEKKRDIDSKILKNNITNLKNDIESKESDVKTEMSKIARLKIQLTSLEQIKAKYDKDWDAEKAKVFETNDDFLCPTCQRKLAKADIEKKIATMKENFNAEKARILTQISDKGKTTVAEIIETNKQIDATNLKIKTFQKNLISLKEEVIVAESLWDNFETGDIDYPAEYETLKQELAQKIKESETPVDNKKEIEDLKSRRTKITDEIDEIKTGLYQVTINEEQKKRIEELKTKERTLSQDIADLEQIDFLRESFIKTKMELLDSRINSRFQFVKFKLFNTLINGAIEETCEPLINGVPFSDANNAAKYNAGIDIINALSDHYDVIAPILIDNRESINELIPTKAQLVNLVVTKDKKLKIQQSTK